MGSGTEQEAEVKTYTITRRSVADVVCMVYDPIGEYHYWLLHLVQHSPDGFEFGYGGSGPADLARSLIGDMIGSREPDARLYQPFKEAFIQPLKGDGPHVIDEETVWDWMERYGHRW